MIGWLKRRYRESRFDPCTHQYGFFVTTTAKPDMEQLMSAFSSRLFMVASELWLKHRRFPEFGSLVVIVKRPDARDLMPVDQLWSIAAKFDAHGLEKWRHAFRRRDAAELKGVVRSIESLNEMLLRQCLQLAGKL